KYSLGNFVAPQFPFIQVELRTLQGVLSLFGVREIDVEQPLVVCNIENDSEICYSVGMLGTSLRLSRPEYKELRGRVRSRVLRAGDVRRARLILMLAEGQSWSAIQQALGCSSAYIARWQARFTQQRLAGLFARHQGRPVSK